MKIILSFLVCLFHIKSSLASNLSLEENRTILQSLPKQTENNMTGKVLLITGPQSSGKSTLVSAMLGSLPTCETINRKELMEKVNQEICKEVLREPLLKIQMITGRKITNLNQLHLANVKATNPEDIFNLEQYKQDILKIISTDFFDTQVSDRIFQKYRESSNHLLIKNQIVLIDEGEIYSNEKCAAFCQHFKGIEVKTCLLFDNLDNLLKKYTARNNHFISLLKNYDSLESFFRFLENNERERGDSRFNYRPLGHMLKNYEKFFTFTPTPLPNHPVLQTLHLTEMKELLEKINQEDQTIQLTLSKWDFFNRKFTNIPMNIDTLIESLFRGSSTTYLQSKIDADYIIKGSFYPDTTSYNLVEQLPTDILRWFSS